MASLNEASTNLKKKPLRLSKTPQKSQPPLLVKTHEFLGQWYLTVFQQIGGMFRLYLSTGKMSLSMVKISNNRNCETRSNVPTNSASEQAMEGRRVNAVKEVT